MRQAEAIALVLRSTGAGRPAAASSAEELVIGFVALQKPLPRYWEPEGQEVPLLPPARNIWFAWAGKVKSERAPAQTRATSKRIGLIGRGPKS